MNRPFTVDDLPQALCFEPLANTYLWVYLGSMDWELTSGDDDAPRYRGATRVGLMTELHQPNLQAARGWVSETLPLLAN